MLELTSILNILSTIALLGALIFAGLQVRSGNRTRAHRSAVAMIQAVQNQGWIKAVSVWQKIPLGSTPEEINAMGRDITHQIEEYGVRLETVGYMVYKDIIGLDVIDEMIGGAAVNFWTRFAPWIEQDRALTSSPRNYEWVQWLAEHLHERQTGQQTEPAYIRYKRWSSPGAFGS
jgi:hypothetical protein